MSFDRYKIYYDGNDYRLAEVEADPRPSDAGGRTICYGWLWWLKLLRWHLRKKEIRDERRRAARKARSIYPPQEIP